MNAIEVNNISKYYGKVQALNNVSFSVKKGEVFGLIGPDGAGKTSMSAYFVHCFFQTMELQLLMVSTWFSK